ncbi:MAG: DUF2267 domain-containing protein [Desulfobacteraceae bacterium]|nr:DUF2267 domain-containing protein [Desulfobacteraceae bacterium]
MTMTGVDSFDKTLQETNIWLKDLMYELNWEDRHKTYTALRACLHALRDRLIPDEAIHLGAELPMLIRGFYFEGWSTKGKPVKERRKADFLDHIRREFNNDPAIDVETVARAVFKLLAHHISRGEIEDIRGNLPKEIEEDLWPHFHTA